MRLSVGIEDVEHAAERIRGYVHRTPVLHYAELDALVGAEVVIKAENLQRTGSFKARGAFNAMLSMERWQLNRGVVAVSSGNHAQAVALAARTLGVPATIVVPEGSNPMKIAATRAHGAEVITESVTPQARESIVRSVGAERGIPLIHPFDDPQVIAGQGTVGLELTERTAAPDAVVVPVGGGGLISGIATAVKDRWPQTLVVGVEPESADDAVRSLRSGERVVLDVAPETVCDGVRALGLGDHTWPVVRELVDDIVTVPDDLVLDAVAAFRQRTGLVVEPSGALTLAAAAAGKITGRRLVLVVSGGNIDPVLLPQTAP